MKKLIPVVVIALAIAGCGRESEQIEVDAKRMEGKSQTLTMAWHKVSEDDGSVCDLSTASYESVKKAHDELQKALAANNMEVAIETLTPERVEGAKCLCNRVLVQGRYVDEWLGAEVVETECSGCPDQAGCPKSAGSESTCGGQTAMVHQGQTYEIVPANLIVMAGMIAAADLSGEKIAYFGHTSGSKVNCACGKCEDGRKCADCEHRCEHHAAGAECSPDCPGAAAGTTPPCQAVRGEEPAVTKPTAPPKKGGCPRAANCRNAGCPSKGSGS